MYSNQALAYFFLRITMGTNLVIHAWVKLGKAYLPFIEKTRDDFGTSGLPDVIVSPLAHAIPWAELLIGITLLFGVYTRLSIIAAHVLMIVLISGQCFLMQWNTVGIQLIYSALFTWLLYKGKQNELSLDQILKRA